MSRVASDPLALPITAASLFSAMALPAHVIERIPEKFRKNGLLHVPGASWSTASPADARGAMESSTVAEKTASAMMSDAGAVLPGFADTGLEQEPAELVRQGQLLRGAVLEFCIAGGAAWGTTLALRACRVAQEQARQQYGHSAWCAFVDPSASLYAPGVQALGLDLKRLLVVRPSEESLTRVALRLVESQVFPVVIIDTMGLPGAGLDVSLAQWVRVVRRMSLAIADTEISVVLLTNRNARRPLQLPVAARYELTRASHQELQVSIPKAPLGQWRGPVRVPLERQELRCAL